MKCLPLGGQWRFVLLAALCGVVQVHAQSPGDASFLSALNELREASYADKSAIAERLSQGGHPSVRVVLTALMEDRLYFRNGDQKIFVVKSSDGDPINLIDPLTLKLRSRNRF